jgi:hypothetical protein
VERVRMPYAVWVGIMMISVFLFLMNGCTGRSNRGAANTAPNDKGFAPPVYYDFGDVRLPPELKVDSDSSFAYRTEGLSMGVLVLKGRVELYSLIGFFENSMAQEDWKFISSFKSPRTMMLFQKANRWCVINITEEKITTQVEIWVSPTLHSTEGAPVK